MPARDLSCVVHVHSRYSDGTGTVAQIAAAARQAGADAVLLTDHDSLAARRNGEERWYGPVLVCVGNEVSPHGQDHVLSFGLDEVIDHDGLDAAQVLDAVVAAGGFGIAAHPFHDTRTPVGRRIRMPFNALDSPALTGIEVWSWFGDTLRTSRLRDVPRFLATPGRFVVGPPPLNLAAWDELCADRPMVGIGGLDAHQVGLRIGGRVPVRKMAYRRSFAHLRTHVLLDTQINGDAAHDRDAVFAALRAGRCYLALDELAQARGTDFTAHDARGAVSARMGEQVAVDDAVTLRVQLPVPAAITLIGNGAPVEQRAGPDLEHRVTTPGAYRVEATLEAHGRERTWILTNPIYVR